MPTLTERNRQLQKPNVHTFVSRNVEAGADHASPKQSHKVPAILPDRKICGLIHARGRPSLVDKDIAARDRTVRSIIGRLAAGHHAKLACSSSARLLQIGRRNTVYIPKRCNSVVTIHLANSICHPSIKQSVPRAPSGHISIHTAFYFD